MCWLKAANHRDGASFDIEYMPPEAFESRWVSWEKEADVYSFGIVLGIVLLCF